MMDESLPSRLLVVCDQSITRDLLSAVLTSQPDLRVVGEAENAEEALKLCEELRPDLVVMDLTIPVMSGIEATRSIKAKVPDTSVLVLTAHADQDLMLEAVRSGAAGYILKGTDSHHVLDAVRAVLGGETPLDQGIAMRLMRRIAEEAGPRVDPQKESQAKPTTGRPYEALPGRLTPRETEVLGYLSLGKTNRQIANELHVSLSTVKRHMERIMPKLGFSDRTQAAVKAVELGLLPSRQRE